SLVHADPGRHTGANARHGAYIGGHLVHHVMRQMAVEHPRAWVVCDEFDVACLCYSDQDRVAGNPRRFWNSAGLRTGDIKRVAVQMHRMMIHAEIDHADTHSVAKPNE